MKRALSTMFLPACALALAGCASINLHDIKESSASQRPLREEKAGLVVSCQLITAPEEVAFFFGDDLTAGDLLPVVVYLENKGQDAFTLTPGRAQLVFEDGSTLVHVPWRTVAEGISFSYWRALPGYFFVLIPGFVIASSVTSTNERINDHYQRLALEEVALPPNAKTQGVLFFAPPEGRALRLDAAARGVDVHLEFQHRAGQGTTPCDVWFHL
jgi:hypothetical protein